MTKRIVVRWQHSCVATLSLCTLLLATPWATVAAQRGSDRTVNHPRTERGEVGLLGNTEDTLVATRVFAPMGQVSTDGHDAGALVGFSNTNRYGNRPWKVDARLLQRVKSAQSYNRYVGTIEATPFAFDVAELPAAVTLTGQHSQTVSVDQKEELSGEFDVAVNRFTLGGILYHDWKTLTGGVSSSGFTTGTTAAWEEGPIAVQTEYDFPSKFGDNEDSYSVTALVTVQELANKSRVVARLGWEKGGTITMRLQVGLLDAILRPHTR